jgi:hypothetical protein
MIRVLLAMLVGGSLAAHAATAFPERVVTKVGELSIEADPADQAYVRALQERLAHPDLQGGTAPLPFGFAELRAQRDTILGELATNLGMPRAAPPMGEVFEHFTRTLGAVQDAMVRGQPGRFSLWRKEDLVARLRAGQQIPGFTLEGDEVAVQLNANFDAPADAPPDKLAEIIGNAWRSLTWPVKIGAESPAADIAASLQALTDFRRATLGAEAGSVMTALHETVEATIVARYVHSADRRWFCEGVANYLALQVIRQRVGAERAQQYYDLEALLAAAGPGSPADLERWPVAENPDARHVPSELNEANYARATSVIARAVAKHGPQLLPRWFAAIGKTPVDEASMRTIREAYRQVTHEDLQVP